MEQLYKARSNVIIFFSDCSSFTSDARHKAIHVKSLKTLIPKQILQMLLKTPPKPKENLPINIFSHKAKEVIKKVYNNIMN